ncbi:MAG: bacterial transcriptional activator domain-containing protein [Acidimicrobiales bacterium]
MVELRSGTLSIDPCVVVDYHEVSAWADRLIRGGATDEDLDSLPSPSELELLPGRYDDWIVFERERFRQRVLHANENLARLLAQQGRFAEAIEAALAAIAAEPLRESAHRVAIDCHLAEHNLVEARRQQLSYVRMLRTDLRIEPSTEFMELVPSSVADPPAEPFDEPLADLTERFVG